jgi:16S rRNA (guanine527-N7)-methyltransferase
MIGSSELARLLEPFALTTSQRQLELITTYINLLMRWNRAVNLTAIRRPEDIVVRHFGESLYLTNFASLDGPLLDVGSGAGFPGLAIKILRPETPVVLLEPVAKKRSFLKEVVRECGFRHVEVCADRVQEFGGTHGDEFESVTLRAVGGFREVLPAASRLLRSHGRLYAWLTASEGERLLGDELAFAERVLWMNRIKVPLSIEREIWVGEPPSAAGVSRETIQ